MRKEGLTKCHRIPSGIVRQSLSLNSGTLFVMTYAKGLTLIQQSFSLTNMQFFLNIAFICFIHVRMSKLVNMYTKWLGNESPKSQPNLTGSLVCVLLWHMSYHTFLEEFLASAHPSLCIHTDIIIINLSVLFLACTKLRISYRHMFINILVGCIVTLRRCKTL